MDEPQDTQGETSSEDVQQGEVAREFRDLGENLKNVLQSAWESPERKKLQAEIEAGLTELGTTINKAADDFQKSPTGQRLHSEAKDLGERVRSGEMEASLREQILSVLREVNARLRKVGETASDEEAEKPRPGS
jgi:ElaB/YqjD/DUF883 family membrane-anchored ribosome-binding protein